MNDCDPLNSFDSNQLNTRIKCVKLNRQLTRIMANTVNDSI